MLKIANDIRPGSALTLIAMYAAMVGILSPIRSRTTPSQRPYLYTSGHSCCDTHLTGTARSGQLRFFASNARPWIASSTHSGAYEAWHRQYRD